MYGTGRELCGNQPVSWLPHAIEQTQLRRKYRVDGVGRPKFDFHTGEGAAADLAAAAEVVAALEAEAPSRTVQKPRYGATMRAKVAACVEINQCVGCTR